MQRMAYGNAPSFDVIATLLNRKHAPRLRAVLLLPAGLRV